MKPCDTPCPKCGSLDILRRFYKRSEKIEASDYGKPPLPRWVGGSGYTWWANRDLISHHCRCCQYDWVDGPLPKQGGQKKSLGPALCEHGNPIDPTGGYVCLKCFRAPSTPLPFIHWSKDPLIPYAGCKCSSCEEARAPVVVSTTETTGDGAK